jgi:predicted RNA-binding protein
MKNADQMVLIVRVEIAQDMLREYVEPGSRSTPEARADHPAG